MDPASAGEAVVVTVYDGVVSVPQEEIRRAVTRVNRNGIDDFIDNIIQIFDNILYYLIYVIYIFLSISNIFNDIF